MTDDRRPPLKPTVLAIPPRARKATPVVLPEPGAMSPPPKPAQTPGPQAGPLRPTAVAGVERERVLVTAADLRRLAPGVDREVINRALELIGSFVVEKASERRAILWGHDLQKAYMERVSEALDLAKAPVLAQSGTYVLRMIQILGSFDLAALAGREGGRLGGVLRGLGGRVDTEAEIEVARGELDHLVQLIAGSLDELLNLKDRIERNAAELESLGREAEAASLAALFLAEHLRPRHPGVADRFVERSMSLTQMVAQLRQQRGLREAQVAVPLRLIGTMQHVVLVALPDLLASLAAFFTRAHGRSFTPTEAGEMTRRIDDIVQQLKA